MGSSSPTSSPACSSTGLVFLKEGFPSQARSPAARFVIAEAAQQKAPCQDAALSLPGIYLSVAGKPGTGARRQPTGANLLTLGAEKHFILSSSPLPDFSASLQKPPALQPALPLASPQEGFTSYSEVSQNTQYKTPCANFPCMPGKSGTEEFAKHGHYKTTGFLWAFLKYVIFVSLSLFFFKGHRALRSAAPALGPSAGISPEVANRDHKVTSLLLPFPRTSAQHFSHSNTAP